MPTRLAPYLLVACVIVTAGLCQQRTVVVPNTVVANHTFTVTCEANRVPNVPSNVTLVHALRMFKRQRPSETYVEVANYVSFNPPGLNNNLKQSFIPSGRNWTFTFSGSTDAGGSPVRNRNTMKVVLVVSDTRVEDAGSYSCYVDYYLPGGIIISSSGVIVHVDFIEKPVLVPNTVRLGQPFTIHCDTRRVHLSGRGQKFVYYLQISRNLGDGYGFVTVAESQCASPDVNPYTRSFIPEGRSWDVTYSGNNITFAFPDYEPITANGVNWDTMRISVKVYDTKREDAGVYKCDVNHVGSIFIYQFYTSATEHTLTVID